MGSDEKQEIPKILQPPEASTPRGFGKLYKQPDCRVLYKPNRAASLSEFHYFAYLSLFLSLLFKTTFPYFKERKKKHSFNTELMKQAPQWDSLLLAVVQMMYLQAKSSKQQQASAVVIAASVKTLLTNKW